MIIKAVVAAVLATLLALSAVGVAGLECGPSPMTQKEERPESRKKAYAEAANEAAAAADKLLHARIIEIMPDYDTVVQSSYTILFDKSCTVPIEINIGPGTVYYIVTLAQETGLEIDGPLSEKEMLDVYAARATKNTVVYEATYDRGWPAFREVALRQKTVYVIDGYVFRTTFNVKDTKKKRR